MSVACDTRLQNGAPDHWHGFAGFPVAAITQEPTPSMGDGVRGESESFGQTWQEVLARFQGTGHLAANDKQPIVAANERPAIAANPPAAAESTPRSLRSSDLQNALSNTLNADVLNAQASIVLRAHIAAAANVRQLDSIAYSDRRKNIGNVGKLFAKDPPPQGIEGKKAAEPQEGLSGADSRGASEFIVAPANLLTAPSCSKQLQERPRYRDSSDVKGTDQNAPPNTPFGLAGDASPNSARGNNQRVPERIEIESATPEKTSQVSSANFSSRFVVHGAHEEPAPTLDAISESGERGLRSQDIPEGQGARMRHLNVPDPPVSAVQSGGYVHQGSIALQPIELDRANDASMAQPLKPAISQHEPRPVHDANLASRVVGDSTFRTAHSVVPGGSKPAFIEASEEPIAQTCVAENAALPGPAVSSESIQRSEKVSETLAAIDAGIGGPASHWTLAGSHRAEAGFQDPLLGWVSVRAQVSAGGILASVVPASDLAAQVLNTHLAGLNAHMAPRYDHLNPVTLASPDAGLNSQNAQEHPDQRDSRDSRQSQEQQGRENSQPPSIDAARRISPRLVGVEMRSTETPAINAGQNSDEHHVSVIV